jgi:hypothetical protein
LRKKVPENQFQAKIKKEVYSHWEGLEAIMSANKYPEAHQLILFVEKVPFSEEEKTKLKELLSEVGMTDETTAEVHKLLTALPKENFSSDWQRAKFNMDLAGILRQWRMTQGSKKFKHSGK